MKTQSLVEAHSEERLVAPPFLTFVGSADGLGPSNLSPPAAVPTLPACRSSPSRRAARVFLLPGQPGEPGRQRVPGWQECFLAVEDGGIGALRVVGAIQFSGPE